MAMVRNSVGAGRCNPLFFIIHVPVDISVIGIFGRALLCVFSDCYVADELVVSRAGRRVRVGNTDAEGRMVMVDLLCEMKEKVTTSRC